MNGKFKITAFLLNRKFVLFVITFLLYRYKFKGCKMCKSHKMNRNLHETINIS